jgi:hypothetical protein
VPTWARIPDRFERRSLDRIDLTREAIATDITREAIATDITRAAIATDITRESFATIITREAIATGITRERVARPELTRGVRGHEQQLHLQRDGWPPARATRNNKKASWPAEEGRALARRASSAQAT